MENRNSGGDDGLLQKKPTKRKFSLDNAKGAALTYKEDNKEVNDEVNSQEDENLLGTIENENDSYDEDDLSSNAESDTVSESELGTESEDESEELSFEDDSEDELENEKEEKSNSQEFSFENGNEEKSRNEGEGEMDVTTSAKSEKHDLRRYKNSHKVTSISETTKVLKTRKKREEHTSKGLKSKSKHMSKSENDNDTTGKFVRPDPEAVLCGQIEEKEEQKQMEEQHEEANEQAIIDDWELKPRKIIVEKKKEHDEYEENDTSDEEDIRNTVGNIPMNWYDDYPHAGYDWEGKKIIKPSRGDELDNFLKKMEDPNFWRTVKDPQTGQDVILCDTDAELIGRLQAHKIPDSQFEEYAPWIEWFSSQVMKTPLRKFPEHKRSFIPSKDEARQVGRIVNAIKRGWIKPKADTPKGPQFYMLWENDDSVEHVRRIHNHIPAPKRHLPIHAESYNPPPEYLFDQKEKKQWKRLKDEPWKRKLHFMPEKYESLRAVPSYPQYIRERFMRCLDLYLCPRAQKMRLLIQPEDLVPQLPSPKDLQPFPTTLALVYKGHTDMVRCITVEPKGQYMASGSDDLTVKIWEVATGRCIRTIPAGGVVRSISWCPNVALSLLAVAADRKLLLINPEVGDTLIIKKTDALLEEAPEQDVLVSEKVKGAVQWEQAQARGEEWRKGIRIIINHFKEIKQVTWHGRGDYFATVMPEAQNRSVVIHQVSKRRSQIPFSRAKGLVQCVLFHPIRPIFFVATQKNVRVYDLAKQEMVKKLLSNAKWISTMAIHPGGDNILVGTYDRKILWFDLDLSTKPYQTLRLHGYAVRGIAYHKRYPLFASGSDDNSVIVSHGMVYNDLLQNPLIVPLKRLSYHEKVDDFSVFEVLFHPSQPWLFSSGADCSIRLYT